MVKKNFSKRKQANNLEPLYWEQDACEPQVEHGETKKSCKLIKA